jgi:hypothetical protein
MGRRINKNKAEIQIKAAFFIWMRTMYSIFHFWKHLSENKTHFSAVNNIADFPFDRDMLSCENKGVFPDIAIKLNKSNETFTGGELIEIKDSKSYVVSSFNSTIPTGKKNIRDIITSDKSAFLEQMQRAGDDVFSLEMRDVYYFVRGKRREQQKICLIHGSFFETISTNDLIRESFSQVLDEGLQDKDVSDEMRKAIKSVFFRQSAFSRVRNVEKASVKLRFRVMTEVKAEGNILNPTIYPEIKGDTLNLIVPYHSDEEKQRIFLSAEDAMGKNYIQTLNVFSIKHPLNGWFLVFQAPLKD